MNTIPDVLLTEIKEHLELRELYHVITTNKSLYDLYLDDFKKQLRNKRAFVIKWFPEIIHELFNGLSTLIFSPYLKFKPIFIGIEYIDSIINTDVNYPIMIGIDYFSRPYITIKTTSSIYAEPTIITIFQRYTTIQGVWTYGTCYKSMLVGYKSGESKITGFKQFSYYEKKPAIIMPELQNNIKRLLNKEGYIIQPSYNNETYSKTPLILWEDKYRFVK